MKACGALALVLALSGCGWMGDDARYAMAQDWQDFKTYDYLGTARTMSGLREAFPSAAEREQAANAKICLNGNGSNRVMTQTGVEDQVDYRRCALGPYATNVGQRMGRRPDFDPRPE